MSRRLHIPDGTRFGRLRTIKELEPKMWNTKAFRRFLLSCQCGGTKIALLWALRQGDVKSCGCLEIENRITHGMAGTKRDPRYTAWAGMKQRCYNRKCDQFQDYGGRGIRVCRRWLHNFAAFAADMGPRPNGTYSIERKDNNKGYSPANCIWATMKTQQRNTRRNVMVTYGGETKCVTEWAEQLGLNNETLRHRIVNKRWPSFKALGLPPPPSDIGQSPKNQKYWYDLSERMLATATRTPV